MSQTPGDERVLPFLRMNELPVKPRSRGMTEIRGAYYTPMGKRYLQDVLETMGPYIDSLKFGGGAWGIYPKSVLRELIELCHQHDVQVSTGGFIEYVLTQGHAAVDAYIAACKELGFDIVEISSGFISTSNQALINLVDQVRQAGMKPKAEVGIQFGAGGASSAKELVQQGVRDPEWSIALARQLLDAGAWMIMVESEGITESVETWRSDIPAKFVNAIGLEKLMFEAADPPVFEWYVKNYGPEVNLFVDHSQIVQLQCLRSGIWGTSGTWGRVIT